MEGHDIFPNIPKTTNPFVCKDTFPPKKKTSIWHILYGGFEGADTHEQRECSVCKGRPILRYVVWWNEEVGLQQRLTKKPQSKAFCGKHLEEAWDEQALHPPFTDWVRFLD